MKQMTLLINGEQIHLPRTTLEDLNFIFGFNILESEVDYSSVFNHISNGNIEFYQIFERLKEFLLRSALSLDDDGEYCDYLTNIIKQIDIADNNDLPISFGLSS